MIIHVVLGKGNLGLALVNFFKWEVVENSYIFSRTITDSPIQFANMEVERGNKVFVWNTEGYGSVPECQKNPREAFEVHVMRNLDLMSGLHKDVTLINFSTNYAGAVPTSEYSASKSCLESLTINHPREKVITVRVANLYSKYFPMKSFQGKILLNKDKVTALPWNVMIPTDCDWLASRLYDTIIRCPIFPSSRWYKRVIEIAPSGSTSANKFGELLLGREIEENHDDNRPSYPFINNLWDDEDDWLTVWEKAKPKFMEAYNREIENA